VLKDVELHDRAKVDAMSSNFQRGRVIERSSAIFDCVPLQKPNCRLRKLAGALKVPLGASVPQPRGATSWSIAERQVPRYRVLNPLPPPLRTLNKLGNVRSRCPECDGALSTYEWPSNGVAHGALRSDRWQHAAFRMRGPRQPDQALEYRLYRCAGSGRGGLGVLLVRADEAFARGSRR
jgi:hypothetical protein